MLGGFRLFIKTTSPKNCNIKIIKHVITNNRRDNFLGNIHLKKQNKFFFSFALLDQNDVAFFLIEKKNFCQVFVFFF